MMVLDWDLDRSRSGYDRLNLWVCSMFHLPQIGQNRDESGMLYL